MKGLTWACFMTLVPFLVTDKFLVTDNLLYPSSKVESFISWVWSFPCFLQGCIPKECKHNWRAINVYSFTEHVKKSKTGATVSSITPQRSWLLTRQGSITYTMLIRNIIIRAVDKSVYLSNSSYIWDYATLEIILNQLWCLKKQLKVNINCQLDPNL